MIVSEPYSIVKPRGFYVYLHIRKSDNLIMYIGKGKSSRAWDRTGRNLLWVKTARKHGFYVRIYKDNMNEVCSLVLESILIKNALDQGHPITNMTSGGDGALSKSLTKCVVERIRRSNSKNPITSSLGISFVSARDAARWLRDNGYPSATGTTISKVCRDGCGSAYGIAWWNCDMEPFEVKARTDHWGEKLGKTVVCSNGNVFISTKDAERWCRNNGWPKASSSSISRCCNGINDMAYGLKWEFSKDHADTWLDLHFGD